MGIETIALVTGGLQLASGVMQYTQQKKADKAAKQAADAQAAQAEADAARAAQEELATAEATRKQQRLAFLKSGVDLSGSPLLVMEETRNKGNENAKNTIDSASARAKSLREQGAVGRASLIGTLSETASNVAGTYTNYQLMKKQIA